jgi:hypothetical protein
VVVATDHVRDLHVVVVHHHAEIVGRRAVGTGDDQVVELGAVEGDRAVHDVVHHDLPLVRVAEADHRIHARHGLAAVPAAAVVARLFLAGHLAGAQLVQLLPGAIAVVGLALAQELVDDLLVTVHALRLVEGSLVVVEAQPLHAVEDRLHRLGRGSLAVGVLDAQDELPAVSARVQPAEQRGAHAADVQHAGGTGSKAGADGHGTSAAGSQKRQRRRRGRRGIWWAVVGLNH